MARQHDYAQSVIGDCGHVCDAWPQITGLGGVAPREVLCDTCTRIRYGIDDRETIGVWVKIVEPKPARKKTKKAVKSTPELLGQFGLLDGS